MYVCTGVCLFRLGAPPTPFPPTPAYGGSAAPVLVGGGMGGGGSPPRGGWWCPFHHPHPVCCILRWPILSLARRRKHTTHPHRWSVAWPEGRKDRTARSWSSMHRMICGCCTLEFAHQIDRSERESEEARERRQTGPLSLARSLVNAALPFCCCGTTMPWMQCWRSWRSSHHAHSPQTPAWSGPGAALDVTTDRSAPFWGSDSPCTKAHGGGSMSATGCAHNNTLRMSKRLRCYTTEVGPSEWVEERTSPWGSSGPVAAWLSHPHHHHHTCGYSLPLMRRLCVSSTDFGPLLVLCPLLGSAGLCWVAPLLSRCGVVLLWVSGCIQRHPSSPFL